jgi:hypothetical protein
MFFGGPDVILSCASCSCLHTAALESSSLSKARAGVLPAESMPELFLSIAHAIFIARHMFSRSSAIQAQLTLPFFIVSSSVSFIATAKLSCREPFDYRKYRRRRNDFSNGFTITSQPVAWPITHVRRQRRQISLEIARGPRQRQIRW